MTKEVEFENAVDDAITDIFETSKELRAAIKYYGNTTIADWLKAHLETYEEMEKADE